MKKKRVLNLTMIYENESLKEYLEHMALKGWKLVKIGGFLVFEACDPHPIRYCVEVMEKPSVYASNQTLPLKQYREFCREAGWEYIGTNGILHVFYTEDPGAIPVETDDQERFTHICRAVEGNNRTLVLLFGLLTLMNLYSCYRAGSILNPNGYVVFILGSVGIWYTGSFYFWKRQALRSLQETGRLPVRGWRGVRRREAIILALVCFVSLLYMASFFRTLDGPGQSVVMPVLIIYLVIFFAFLFIFSKVLHWLREKKSYSRKTNILIYWGIALLLFILTTAIGSSLIFWII